MIKDLKELYSLLTIDQQRKLIKLQLLVVIMALAEVIGVLGIGPFMTIVSDMSSLENGNVLSQLYALSNIDSPRNFLIIFGGAVLMLLFTSSCISMFTVWRLHLYGARVGAELSSRLYNFYVHKPWLFHSSTSSSELIKQIAQECQRTSINIIKPLMQLNAKLVMALFMVSAMFIYNAAVMLVGILVFFISYIIIYRLVKPRLTVNGKVVSSSQERRYKLLNEGFGGIKDVLLLGRQKHFEDQFSKASHDYFQALGTTQGLSQVPRYAMEFIAYGSIIFLVLYLLSVDEGGISSVAPVLAVFALAGFKLLPAFQQIYSNLSLIRGNLAAFNSIKTDLYETVDRDNMRFDECTVETNKVQNISFEREIFFKDVTFKYPGKTERALNDLNIKIPVNKVIGIVGPSGSGKSTIIDILLGLITPQKGGVYIDDVLINKQNIQCWQKLIGFVPQSIFLSDGSVRENIAFGLPADEIDENRIKRSTKLAHLDELISQLPEGLNTHVGERGVQLSGGQRQRIGIARALYENARILILDEATSALDGVSEKIIMDAIHDFSGSKTIIMIAHRLNTVKKCDCIYLIENGGVVDSGSFSDLMKKNNTFRNMSILA
tara:strand:+ start:79522 stop:81336 length:1815 start_codon:yes stop_codon:yes gene_type:complete